GPIRCEVPAPVHADHLERDSLTVYVNDDVEERIRAWFNGWALQVLHCDVRSASRPDGVSEIGLAGVAIQWRPAATADDLFDTIRGAGGRVALNPVLEQVLVSREQEPDVMLPEEWHPPCANGCSLSFESRAPVWTR